MKKQVNMPSTRVRLLAGDSAAAAAHGHDDNAGAPRGEGWNPTGTNNGGNPAFMLRAAIHGTSARVDCSHD